MNKKIKILLKIDGTRELKISLYMQLGEKVYYSLSSVNLLQVNRFLSLKKILQVWLTLTENMFKKNMT